MKPIQVKLAGKQFDMHFGINQSAVFCDLRKIDLSEYMQLFNNIAVGKFNLGHLRDLFYSGIVAGSQYKNETIPVTRESLGFLMDELQENELTIAMEQIAATFQKEKGTPETDVKKNISE